MAGFLQRRCDDQANARPHPVDGGVNPRKSGDDRKAGTRFAACDQPLLAIYRSDANGCPVALCQRRQPPKAGAVGQCLQRVAGQSSWTIKNDGWFRIAKVRLTRERPYAKTVRFSERPHRRLRADSRRRQHIPAFNPSATAERPLMAQFMSAQGPLAREVRDVRLGLEVMSQRDIRDPWWVPAPLEWPPMTKPIKVALARISADMDTDPEVISLVRTAADHLASAGYDVTEAELPDLAGTWRLWCDLIMTELSVLQEAQMREHGSADFRQSLDGFLKMATILDGRAYMETIARRSRVLRNWLDFLETFPIILTPLSVKRTPATRGDLDGDASVRSLFWNDLRFMSSINVLGLPAAVVPAGLVSGTPVGVQLIGSRYREDLCLNAAAAIEAKVGIMAKRLWGRS
jgi:Amidase